MALDQEIPVEAEPLPGIDAAIAALENATIDIAALDDRVLVAAASRVERLGRLVDAHRIAVAGEIDHRSDRERGDDRLSGRFGCRNGNELLERTTGAAPSAIAWRIRLGREVRARHSLTGQPLPAERAEVAAAIAAGRIGADSADAITRMLARVADHVGAEHLHAAERALVDVATGDALAPARDAVAAETDADAGADGTDGSGRAATFAEVKIHTQVWEAWLDPDGAEPARDRAVRTRGIWFGRERGGVIPFSGRMLPEVRSQFVRLADAHLNPARKVRFTDACPDLGAADGEGAADADGTAGADGATGANGTTGVDGAADVDGTTGADGATGLAVPVEHEGWNGDPTAIDGGIGEPWGNGDTDVVADQRTRPQKLHDLLAVFLQAAAGAEDAPLIGGAGPTVMIAVTEQDLVSRTGHAQLDGIDTPVPVTVAERAVCSGYTQKVVLDTDGRIVRLGTHERIFTPHQRRAISLRDGGCIIPGCTVPPSWCEIHHVVEHSAGGATHIDNGVLLCWWHHHQLETSGWKIRMHHGVPYVRAPFWINGEHRWHRVSGSLIRQRLHTQTGAPPGSPGHRVPRRPRAGGTAPALVPSGAPPGVRER